MYKVYIALHKLQVVVLILFRMVFHLFSKIFAVHLGNSTAKAYLCNQVGTVSTFLSRLACYMQLLTNKCGITFIMCRIDI